MGKLEDLFEKLNSESKKPSLKELRDYLAFMGLNFDIIASDQLANYLGWIMYRPSDNLIELDFRKTAEPYQAFVKKILVEATEIEEIVCSAIHVYERSGELAVSGVIAASIHHTGQPFKKNEAYKYLTCDEGWLEPMLWDQAASNFAQYLKSIDKQLFQVSTKVHFAYERGN